VYWNLAGTRQEHLYPILEEEAHRECPNCKSPNTKEESVNPYTCPNCVGELDTNF
jgi:Zn finger protein HypA/HybF involved in hydrogenase expression